MLRIATIIVAAALATALVPAAGADGSETRGYVTSIGVGANGAGASSNWFLFGPGAFVSHAHNTVRVDAVDDSGTIPYMTVCVDVNGNGICTSGDGDVRSSGAGTVTVTSASSFTEVIVFVYALHVTTDLDVNLGTTGVVTVTWG